jgi:hypothetical protein
MKTIDDTKKFSNVVKSSSSMIGFTFYLLSKIEPVNVVFK